MLKNNIDEFNALLKEQPDITNSLRGDNGHTLLMKGATHGDTQIVIMLSRKDHDLSVVDDGWNVLRLIVLFNDDDVSLEMLNSLDATQLSSDVINGQHNYTSTPLHIAAVWNNYKSIVWLLEHEADRSLTNRNGERPGEYGFCNDETRRLIRLTRK